VASRGLNNGISSAKQIKNLDCHEAEPYLVIASGNHYSTRSRGHPLRDSRLFPASSSNLVPTISSHAADRQEQTPPLHHTIITCSHLIYSCTTSTQEPHPCITPHVYACSTPIVSLLAIALTIIPAHINISTTARTLCLKP